MRSINPEKVAPWFDPWKLKAEFMFRGYDNYGAPIARILNVAEHTAKDKMSQSRLTHEETIEIARFLKLTPKQYGDIFLKNLYAETDEEEK